MIKTELKVGLFIILSTLLILSGLGYMSYKKGLFQAEETFTLSSQTGDGLTVGMPLIFSGFKIGKITDLELDAQGLVLVKIRVPSQHYKWLRSDSKFILERPLIGSTKLVMVTTNMNSPLLTSKSIPTVTEVNDINETIKKIRTCRGKDRFNYRPRGKIDGNHGQQKILSRNGRKRPGQRQSHSRRSQEHPIDHSTDGWSLKEDG